MSLVPNWHRMRTTDHPTQGEPVRRTILAIAAIGLLTTACSTGAADKPQSASRPTATAATSSGAKGLVGGAPTPSGKLVVAIPAAKLPYKPDAGIPSLDDVKILKTASDPCTLPADNSGEEVQLLGASNGGPGTLNITFSFSNPCAKPVVLSYKVTSAIGSATGEQAGGGSEGTTVELKPGQTVKQTIPVDVSEDLTPAQQKRLWVGCTEVGKQDP
ncbi:hypothetical protein R6V09_01095 [Streptomyces sp. W16]|uniref:hypothetical protein n=1 Tax=Streptomyces sp. W16 TaxID=3076631 RepID=UPI00295C22DF|nr:hypothetical protein [Streptomyces sp. W16]MDV9168739.1 hypothetical protein [Streptomyces sp. W16]